MKKLISICLLLIFFINVCFGEENMENLFLTKVGFEPFFLFLLAPISVTESEQKGNYYRVKYASGRIVEINSIVRSLPLDKPKIQGKTEPDITLKYGEEKVFENTIYSYDSDGRYKEIQYQRKKSKVLFHKLDDFVHGYFEWGENGELLGNGIIKYDQLGRVIEANRSHGNAVSYITCTYSKNKIELALFDLGGSEKYIFTIKNGNIIKYKYNRYRDNEYFESQWP